MAKYQVEVTETFYYYIVLDSENEIQAKKLALTKIDPLGMEYSTDFVEEGSNIAVESILPVEDEVPLNVETADISQLYAHLTKLN